MVSLDVHGANSIEIGMLVFNNSLHGHDILSLYALSGVRTCAYAFDEDGGLLLFQNK